MSSTLTAGSSYRCPTSETEISDIDVDNDEQCDEQKDNDNVGLPRYTREDLMAFDGRTPGLPIYVAVLGNVYDVSAGIKFYGPGN